MDSNSLQVCRLCFLPGNEQMNIFNQTESSLNVAEVIEHHFQCEVSESDIFPNAVCFDCWIKTKSFHTFYESVTSAREDFLKQYLSGGGVKIEYPLIETLDASSEQCSVRIDIEPVINSEEEKPYVEHSKLSESECEDELMNQEEQTTENDFQVNIKDECEDNENVGQPENVAIMHELEFNDETETFKPLQIQDVSSVQKQQIIDQFFDMTCDQCDARFESLQNAQTHYKKEHDIEKGYIKCCQRKLSAGKYVGDHILWHLNPEAFKCEICGVIFNNKRSLYSHRFLHKSNELKKFICDICGSNFSFKHKLTNHKLRMHGPNAKPRCYEESNSYACKHCNKRFEKRRYLEEHVKRYHSKECFKCKFCSKSFMKEENLTAHIKIIHVPEMEAERKLMEQNKMIAEHFDKTCDMCTANLNSLDQAKIHYKTEHDIADGYLKCCGLKFKEINLVKDHIMWHVNPDIFKCIFCGQDMKRRRALHAHHQNHKSGTIRKYKCDICKKGFGTRAGVEYHILYCHVPKLSKDAVCDICSKSFRLEKHLAAHILLAHSEHNDFGSAQVKSATPLERQRIMAENFDMSCDKCEIQLESLKAAKSHYFTEHKLRIGYIKCCNMKLKDPWLVEDHIDWHLNPEAFKCKVCQNLFKDRSKLKIHMARHEAIESDKYVCRVCSKAFVSVVSLNNHTKAGHPDFELALEVESTAIGDDSSAQTGNLYLTETDSKAQIPKDTELIIPEYFNMTCDLCSADLESFSHATEHYLHKHSIEGYIKCCNLKFSQRYRVQEHINWHSNPETFKCHVCQKCFRSNQTLRSHLHIHGSKHKCNVCGKAFQRNCTLKLHLTSVHGSKEPQFKCELCKKRFSNELNLKCHVSRMHTPSNSRICDICAKVCKSNSLLKSHLRSHSEQRAVLREKAQCDICGTWLSNRYTLKTHMLKHTSGAQKCDQCGKIAQGLIALQSHIKKVHTDAIYKCHLCDKSFKLAVALKDHVATHTGEKLYKCLYCPDSFIWRPNCYSHQKKAHPREWSEDQLKKTKAKSQPKIKE